MRVDGAVSVGGTAARLVRLQWDETGRLHTMTRRAWAVERISDGERLGFGVTKAEAIANAEDKMRLVRRLMGG